MKGPYRAFGYPLTPILFIGTSAWIAYAQIKEHRTESLVVALVLIAGGILYKFAVPPVNPEPPPDPKLAEARVVDG
jgi:hypothetical protein